MGLWPEAVSPLALAFEAASRPVKETAVGRPAPAGWEDWLQALFPRHVLHPFAAHHAKFWDWLWAIDTSSVPDPFVAVWSRGGAKSTSAELGTTALGVRGARKYALYVRETQDQADNSVSNIASLLGSSAVEVHYPAHADRLLDKYGASKGWRRNRLRTEGGFTVDALGLDAAGRGAKVEEQRPDLIILDDVDSKHDSPQTTARKIATITTSILPAGASNVCVLGIQNLIIPNGVFARIVDGRADFLSTAELSGPIRAVDALEWEYRATAGGRRRAMVQGGFPTWEGQGLEECQKQIDRFGISSFLKECQHEVRGVRAGVVLNVTDDHREDLTDEQCIELVKMGVVFGGVDFGSWRFAFTLWAVDRHGVPHRIDEIYDQRMAGDLEGAEQSALERRAKRMKEMCSRYGCPETLRIWGDAANPTDIGELNAYMRKLESRLRVVPVAMEHKVRNASVERLDDLLGRRSIRFRRLAPYIWNLRMNAASDGEEMTESRLEWEMDNWAYPVPAEGTTQKQDPSDDTADGADMIASMRYAIMSWWKPAKPEEVKDEREHYDKKGDDVIDRLAKVSEMKRKQMLKLIRSMAKEKR